MTSSPGWLADPTGRHEYRYWDSAWTEYVADGGVTTVDRIGSGDTNAGAVPGLTGPGTGDAQLARDHSRTDPAVGAASDPLASGPLKDPEVERARKLMEQYAASTGGDYDRVEECLVAVGRAGGYRGLEHVFDQMLISKTRDVGTVWDWNEPWQWLLRVSSRAYKERVGDELLPAQVLLFAFMFTEKLAPQLKRGNFAEFGYYSPRPETYTKIATSAMESLAGIPSEVPVMRTPIEVVDVGMTRKICDHVLRAAT